jgi:Core-2/I-Branching enzyme.
MPKIAHLILAHSRVHHVARLARQLNHADATVFIHIDAKSPLESFLAAAPPDQPIRFVRKRRPVTWGGYSMVQATLNAYREILGEGEHYDFINLLSESDYPLKKATAIHQQLAGSIGRSFMEMRFSGDPWWEEAQIKINKYHFTEWRIPGKYLLERAVNHLVPARRLPAGMAFTGRSQWLTLSCQHARYVLDKVDNTPAIERFFQYTWGADEFFFQTLLYNSPHREELVNDNLRYIQWINGKSSPEILTRAHFESMRGSEKCYARKFCPETDPHILAMIDEQLLT